MPTPTDVLERTLKTGEELDFEGYSKHDALNARWLEVLMGWSKWPRLLAIQPVMRFPYHIRPLLGVKRARNCKGLSLFTRAYLTRYRLNKNPEDAKQARALLDWLIANPSPGEFAGLCWGYPYPWQDIGFFAPRNFPNRVVTSFVTMALIEAYETLDEVKYLNAAKSSVKFLNTPPKVLYDDPQHRCLSYVPHNDINWVVMDVSALVGAVSARLAKHTGDGPMMRESARLMRYVASKQTDYGAWFYSDPPGDSHITHDNYHTGFICDAFLFYNQASDSDEFRDVYQTGLDYYEKHLFEPDGAPRFMNDQQWPYDIHGCAQGIISFSLAQSAIGKGHTQATRVLEWTLEHMYDPDSGWFYYQKKRFGRTAVRLLRWCQAWMAYALACYLEFGSPRQD